MTESMISVTTILIDSNTLFREGLSLILSETRFRPFARLSRLDDLNLVSAPGSAPVLFMADLGNDPEIAAAGVARLKASSPSCWVVALADHCAPRHLAAVLKAGADGYLLKTIACETLVTSLDLILLGERVFPSSMLSVIFGGDADAPVVEREAPPRALSQRETDILRQLVNGDPNKVIARKFEITEATVKVHIKAILRKIRVRNRTQAAIWAMDNGFAPHSAAA